MSDIEAAVTGSKRIEKLLEERLGARGRGLHEKVSSVERKLPERIVKRIRFIASVRNAVVHGDEEQIRDRAGFEAAVEDVAAYLTGVGSRSAPRRGVAVLRLGRLIVAGLLAVGVLYFVALYLVEATP